MMRELIERFGYRFQLWTQEREGDHLGAGETRPPVKIYRKDESVFQMVVRYVGVTAMSITIFAIIGRNIIRFFPRAAFAVGVTLAIFIPLWILCGLTVFIAEFKAKKEVAAQNNKSSNQSMQPTAGRSDE